MLFPSGAHVVAEPAPASAYRALFDTHAPALRRYAQRIVRSRESAEDVVQEVFLRLWVGWDRVEVGAGTRSYLYIATRDRALTHLRHARRESREGGEAGWPTRACAAEAEGALVAEELAARVRASLQRMPPRQREVARLRVLEQRTTAEIAAALGLSRRTVELYVARATKAFRAELVSPR